MIRMKALRSFGVPGANEGKVKRGREMTVVNEYRARELENAGLAYRLEAKLVEPAAVNRMIPPASNEAANTGPLASVGGMTGAEAPAPSSPPDLPPRKRRGRPPLNRPKDDSTS